MKKQLTYGFTLIELLIVVAIIAILAAIAVPNFLEAQVRAKVSRAKADMRSISTGLESYRLDHNGYVLMMANNMAFLPPERTGPQYQPTMERLTTPISYLTGRGTFSDPFPAKGTRRLNGAVGITTYTEPGIIQGLKEYFYVARDNHEHVQWGDSRKPTWYLLQSSGPELLKWYIGTEMNAMVDNPAARNMCLNVIYDATNGTVSAGTIWRLGGQPDGRGSVLGKVLQNTGKDK